MESLLLFAKPFHYVYRRLRFVSLQRVMMILVRYAEWVSFENLISHRFALAYLIFRYLLEFLNRYRWSTLEGLRAELSRLRANREHRLYHEALRDAWIRAWSGLAILFPLLTLLTFLGIRTLSTRYGINLPVPALAIIAMGLINLSCDWILKTLQSFLFSVTRTQRPFWSMTGLDLLHAALLFFVARNHGAAGIVLTFVLNTALRIWLSARFTLKTMAAVGIPRLPIPKPSPFQLRFSGEGIKSGLVIPALELPFFLSVLFYHLAIKNWDPLGEHLFFLFIVSPLYLTASGVAYLYYVDFLKFRDRVYQRVFDLVLWDALRALATYTILMSLLGAGVYFYFGAPGIDRGDFAFAGLMMLSWGVYFLGTLAAFIKGARASLIALGLLCAFLISASWDAQSLFLLSALVPAGFGILGIFLSRKDRIRPVSQWVSRELIPDQAKIQGVLLSTGNLGFSLSEANQELFSALPPGSLVGFHDRRSLVWSTPEGSKLDRRELLRIFGVYWDQELESRKELQTAPPPPHAVLWRLGEALPAELRFLDSPSQKRLLALMKQKVRGRGKPSRSVGIGFRPVFEDGVWVGGYVWKKSRHVS